jgi:beta-glucanase (GH16 family)
MAYLNYFGQVMATTPWHAKTTNGSSAASAVNSVLSGTSGGDNFIPNAVRTMSGGLGDDMYQYVTMDKVVVESANGGIDTVYVNSSYVMPDNVENLTVWYAPAVKGNGLGNLMIGSGAAETINGAGGNDVLVGKGGHDVFRFDADSGYDVVTDFMTSGADSDIVRLAGYGQFTRFEQVKAAMTQSGSDVILKLDGTNAVKFSNHAVADFTAANFQLGLDLTGYRLTFADEFNALSLWDGASSGTWRTDYGYGATRDALGSRTLTNNREQEIYVDAAMKGAGTNAIGITPFAIDDGVLTITASPTPDHLRSQLYDMNYVSGLLTTKQSFAQQYGYFEARMDVPEGSGLWPAFWLLPADGAWPPEIDIMESYGTAGTVFTAHSAATGSHTQARATDFDPAILTGFHTYGMLWTAETLSWYLDGVKIFEQATPPDLNRPMYMIVNLAVTGDAPTGMTGELQVDYVRAYSLSNTPPAIQKLVGTGGDDLFTITSTQDTIREASGGGQDRVLAYADYTLPGNVEHLTLTGAAVRGTGNGLANTIVGNGRDNVLEGGSGDDTLNGGAGADRMVGGTGNDTYHVDNVRDVVVELASQGRDTVWSAIDYALSVDVENLILTGAALRGTGNAAANTITGNALDNVLTGGGGNDTLAGGAGRDTFVFAQGFGRDVISDFAVGQDSIDWSALSGQGFAPMVKAFGTGSIVSFGADTITILGVTPGQLADYHLFG